MTVELGRAVFAGQLVQDAARLAARELALAPLPADASFEDALSRVFDPCGLVIDLDAIPDGLTLDEYFRTLPALNQVLRAGMIADTPVAGGPPRRVLRYPGALVGAGGAGCPTVAVPLVTGRSAQGVETIQWVAVVEEIRTARIRGRAGSRWREAGSPPSA